MLAILLLADFEKVRICSFSPQPLENLNGGERNGPKDLSWAAPLFRGSCHEGTRAELFLLSYNQNLLNKTMLFFRFLLLQGEWVKEISRQGNELFRRRMNFLATWIPEENYFLYVKTMRAPVERTFYFDAKTMGEQKFWKKNFENEMETFQIDFQQNNLWNHPIRCFHFS